MSSSDLAIRVVDVSKAYTIRHNKTDHVTLAELALDRLKHPLRRAEREEFWALRQIDFEVRQGEVLGLVGRNGAGKSTLLKVLSRITDPTTGRVDLWGRVGSLLEVGTGFHPELTGRENIYLNGSILGMTRKEIDKQFDAIVDFAGVERFLDTPVKRYSSGMYVRLAFAVAAHLETEILLVDEVLAVGDQEFQRRCLGKMRDVATSGRTVIFVSHQMESIQRLCDSVVVLSKGTVDYVGETDAALDHYLTTAAETDPVPLGIPSTLTGLTLNSAKIEHDTIRSRDDVILTVSLSSSERLDMPYYVSVHVVDDLQRVLLQCDSRLYNTWLDGSRDQTITFRLKDAWLNEGTYALDLFLCTETGIDQFHGVASFGVVPPLPYPYTAPPDATGQSSLLADFEYTVDDSA